jgi:hypothetical protein
MDKTVKGVFLYILTFTSFIQQSIAQEWTSPALINGVWVHTVFKNDTDGKLFIAGPVTSIDNSMNIYGVASYDGEFFSTINGTVLTPIDNAFPGRIKIKQFQDKLYFYGKIPGANHPVISFMENDSVSHNYLVYDGVKWSNWDIEWTDPNNEWNNHAGCIEVIDDELWVVSYKQFPQDPFRWARVQPDGITIHYEIDGISHPVISTLMGTFSALVKWGNHYYLAGRFFQVIDGISTPIHIIKWDGNDEFELLPQAFYGGSFTEISSLAVYQNKLVVGGSFSMASSGSPSDYIMTWDGTQWSPLTGYGVNGIVSKIKVIQDILYFAGTFNQIIRDDGPYVASKIAYFDGNQAYRLSEESISSQVIDFEEFQGKLYIAGNIQSIQFQNYGNIARFEGELPNITNIREKALNQLLIYPNPCISTCSIKLDATFRGGELLLFDSKGTIINAQRIEHSTGAIELSFINNYPYGLYLVKLVSDDGNTFLGKLIHGL